VVERDQVFRPADELAQREEIAGTTDDGIERAGTPALVQVSGIVIARPAAALQRASGGITLAAGTLMSVVGPTPQRRRLVLVATEDIRIGDQQASVSGTTGFLLPANLPHEVFDTGAVWAYCLTNDTTLSWWHEMDVG
jgi:hypothetical protein